jgi:hypothetical protein
MRPAPSNRRGEFPNYAALSNPLPVTRAQIQALLSDDEALVLFAVAEKESYVVAITRESADWLPFHLLVTSKPAAAIPDKFDGYRDAA